MIIAVVQLTSTKLLVRKSVDETRGIGCLLCSSWVYCNELRR